MHNLEDMALSWYASFGDLARAGITLKVWLEHHRARRRKLADMEQRKELW